MSAALQSPWPDGCEAAISLTFDDGMKSQLERAIPYMNKTGLRGTFYVNPRGEDWRAHLDPWREVAAAGHEIGNHTCNHPCSRNLWGNSTGLETMTLAEVEADILEAERRLAEALPEQKSRSFCYPCYQQHVGEGSTRQSYVPVVAKHFIAGRGGTAERGHMNDPLYCDLHYLLAQPCERMWAHEMIGMCERAATQGKWFILVFHGITQEHLAVADADFRELCDHLIRHRKRFFSAPVIDVAQRVQQWRPAAR